MTPTQKAVSTSRNAKQAVGELYQQLCGEDNDPELCLFFCSPSYDLDMLEQEFSEKFGDIPLVGCTTAGEITPLGYKDDSITAIAFSKEYFRITVRCITNIDAFELQDGIDIGKELVCGLTGELPHASGQNTFAFMLIDGLCNAEEKVTASIGSQLGNIPLIGGSTADGWDMDETSLFYNKKFSRNISIIMLMHTELPFQFHYTHHYVAGNARAVITKADPVKRIAYEINGLPAVQEYARLCGVSEDDLNISTYSMHPFLLRIGGKYYSRGIVEVNKEKQTVRFACAIGKGVVYAIARPSDPKDNLRNLFDSIKKDIGPFELVLGCDCLARKMIFENQGILPEMSDIYMENNVIGFATFGEQYNTIHMNNSFCCIAIGQP